MRHRVPSLRAFRNCALIFVLILVVNFSVALFAYGEDNIRSNRSLSLLRPELSLLYVELSLRYVDLSLRYVVL